MVDMPRRKFVLASLGALSVAISLPAVAWAMDPLRGDSSMGGVAALAAFADGRVDATGAIQSLVDAQPPSGGTVNIPLGRYLIDAEKGIALRSGIQLVLASGTELVARSTSSGNYSIIKIYNVDGASVHGGTIIGERDRHLGTGGEWGFGIDIRGSSGITIADVSVSKCWGDGFYIGSSRGVGSSNVVLDNVTAVNNRRQGLSIVACVGAKIINSKFLSTSGTVPGAGIDLEPNGSEKVSDVLIRNCDITGNAGSGVQTWNATSGIRVVDCRISGNKIHGIILGGIAKDTEIGNNSILNNGGNDIYVGKNVSALKIGMNRLTPSLVKGSKKAVFYQAK